VGNRAWCPACDDETSTIWAAFERGEDCPYCGLSAAAAAELVEFRRRGAEFALVVSTAQAERRAQEAERESARLRKLLARAREALAEAVVT
jgi:uncharacterized OB-fold protein